MSRQQSRTVRVMEMASQKNAPAALSCGDAVVVVDCELQRGVQSVHLPTHGFGASDRTSCGVMMKMRINSRLITWIA